MTVVMTILGVVLILCIAAAIVNDGEILNPDEDENGNAS